MLQWTCIWTFRLFKGVSFLGWLSIEKTGCFFAEFVIINRILVNRLPAENVNTPWVWGGGGIGRRRLSTSCLHVQPRHRRPSHLDLHLLAAADGAPRRLFPATLGAALSPWPLQGLQVLRVNLLQAARAAAALLLFARLWLCPKPLVHEHAQNVTKRNSNYRLCTLPAETPNLTQEEVKRRLNSGNACHHSAHNFLSCRLLSKNEKNIL
jgi:hypothetical protein